VNYLIVGTNPSAGELADMVRARIPDAQIDFQPSEMMQPLLDRLTMRYDDNRAREEWGWQPHYSQEEMVDDFLQEMRLHPERYV
jgi:nucleoside-diphosphate-sugar epimerase